jgi:hypothetical protein
MKKALLLGILLTGTIIIQAYAQCSRTHFLCTENFSKEQKAEFWNLNNQSRSATVEKGKVYELSFIAYEGFEYRISTCTDIVDGSQVEFQLSKDVAVRVKDANGNSVIKRQREVFYDNKDDDMSTFISFSTDKTKKFYISVTVPATGDSENKKLIKTDNVCVGALIEHKKSAELGF